MVQFIPAKNDWADVFQSIGKGASEGYQQSADQRSLQKAISSLPPDATPRQIIDSLTGAKVYNPQAQQQAIKNYMGVEEFEHKKKVAEAEFEQKKKATEAAHDIATAKNAIAAGKERRIGEQAEQTRKNTREIVNQLDLPDDKKKVLAESLTASGAEALLKEQLNPKETTFQKTYGNKLAEEYANIDKEIPKLEDHLDTIKYARQLSDSIGFLGQGLNTVGLSGKGKELESTTFPLIEPILKMLAPSGAIAKEKLIRAENKYAISGSDNPWNRKAKLDALERFTKQAIARGKKRQEKIEQYSESPIAKQVIDRFDRESDTIVDAMLDYDLVGEEADIPGMPPASKYKGEEVDGPDGTLYTSDGTRWIKT